MEDWNCDENQGKRKDQVETTYKIMFTGLVGIALFSLCTMVYLLVK